jgi:RNA polymerase sigma-54 factor
MFQIHSQSLRPLTTAHLAQTMTLLSLTCEELKQQIESEVASNPALELVEERRCPTCHLLLPVRGSCPVCSRPKSDLSDEPVVFLSPGEDFQPRRDVSDEYQADEQDYSPIEEDLPTYVLRQIAADLKVEDRQVAAYLLAHLDEDGLLSLEPVEVATYYHIPISRVTEVQNLIQRADPIGVGSCSPQQALLVQLSVLSETQPVPDLARLIVQEAMDLLSRRQYSELAHRFNSTLRKIVLAVKFISENLNPFPARSHYGDVRQPSSSEVQVYLRPDIIINYLNGDPNNPLSVEIIMPLGGTLRINPLFRKAIQQADADKREAWKND